MNDSQSKITSFFRRPESQETPPPRKESVKIVNDDSNGYGSDRTEIYEYEDELSENISQLQTNSPAIEKSKKKKPKKLKKKITLPPTKKLKKFHLFEIM